MAAHPLRRVPAALSGFALWNVLVLLVMLLAYGYPTGLFRSYVGREQERAFALRLRYRTIHSYISTDLVVSYRCAACTGPS